MIVGRMGQPSDNDSTSLQVNDKEHEIARQSAPSYEFVSEKVCR
jgi:hypothetical protein